MKTVLALVASVFVLLVSFQNCQKPPHPDEIASRDGAIAAGVVSKVNLNEESVQDVAFMVKAMTSVTHPSGHVYQVQHQKVLSIDLATGHMVVSSEMDNVTSTYCLTDEMKDELISLLSSSQVCKMGEQPSPGQLCAQSVQEPYAELQTDRSKFSLGYASDACGSNAVDLCGEQANMLKGYIQALNNQYASMACSW